VALSRHNWEAEFPGEIQERQTGLLGTPMLKILRESYTVTHTEAVHHIVWFLAGTRDEGVILSPKEISFECYADADFCGLWNRDTAEHDASTAKSRLGYLLTDAACPIVWCSTLAGPICLSTTEAEYVALSVALHQVIPIMDLLEEMKV
jgi:hypothetical protein